MTPNSTPGDQLDADADGNAAYRPSKKTLTRSFGLKVSVPWILKAFYSEKWFTELKAEKEKKK